jgi:ATP-dependent Clp protease adapter protein ClpS
MQVVHDARMHAVATPIVEAPGVPVSDKLEETQGALQYRVRFFHDRRNPRDTVPPALMAACGIDSGGAYIINQHARSHGSASVGVWLYDVAETCCGGLLTKGLQCKLERIM